MAQNLTDLTKNLLLFPPRQLLLSLGLTDSDIRQPLCEHLNIRCLGELIQRSEVEIIEALNRYCGGHEHNRRNAESLQRALVPFGLSLGTALDQRSQTTITDWLTQYKPLYRDYRDVFKLSVRCRKVLYRVGAYWVIDILMLDGEELLTYKNFGYRSLQELKAQLQEFGWRLNLSFIECLALIDSPSPVT